MVAILVVVAVLGNPAVGSGRAGGTVGGGLPVPGVHVVKVVLVRGGIVFVLRYGFVSVM
jgi:hypothetical protein